MQIWSWTKSVQKSNKNQFWEGLGLYLGGVRGRLGPPLGAFGRLLAVLASLGLGLRGRPNWVLESFGMGLGLLFASLRWIYVTHQMLQETQIGISFNCFAVL